MNIIVLLSIIISSNIYAQLNCSPRKNVNIVYINGIATEKNGYTSNRNRLETVIRLDEVMKRLLLKSQEYEIDNKLYNPSEGHFNDLVESVNQVLILSQEGEYSKTDVYKLLARLKFGSVAGAVGLDPKTSEKIIEIFHYWRKGLNSLPLQQKTVDDIYNAIKPKVDLNERVFIVSHSQGNLFANEVLKRLYVETEAGSDERFQLSANVANMRLAPPSSVTYGSSSYMKFDVDWVVSDLIGAEYNYVVKKSEFRYSGGFWGALASIIGNFNTNTAGFGAGGDITGHGMKEVYLSSDVYVSKIGTNEGYKSAENVFVNDMEALAQAFSDTCSYKLEFDISDVSLVTSCGESTSSYDCTLDIKGLKARSDFTNYLYENFSSNELFKTVSLGEQVTLDRIPVHRSYDSSNVKYYISIPSQYHVKYNYLNQFEYRGSFNLSTVDLNLVVRAQTKEGFTKINGGEVITHSERNFDKTGELVLGSFVDHSLVYGCSYSRNFIYMTFSVGNSSGKTAEEIESAIRGFDLPNPGPDYECRWIY